MLSFANPAILMAILVATAIGGLAWVFLYPMLSGERQAEKRRESVAQSQPIQRSTRNQKSRREQVEESLKDLENKQKKNQKPSLQQRIAQAGLTWSKRQYFLISAGMGIVAFCTILFMGFGMLAGLGFGFAAGFGLPFWMLSYLKKRREKRFLQCLSGCRRRDRARHQVRSAVARQHADDRATKARNR